MRRQFAFCFAAVLAAGVSLAADGVPAWAKGQAGPPKFPDNVGLQLYSVREQTKADLPGTLALIHKMGFRNVEVDNLHGKPAAELKQMLDGAGLRPISMHESYQRFRDDLAGVVADAKALGLKYIGCGGVPHRGEYTQAHNDEAIEVFTRAGKALARAGVRLVYHTHGDEFRPSPSGGTFFDDMVKRTQPGVLDFQMDVYWVVFGGADPLVYLKKYPDRILLTHLKDMKKGVVPSRAADGDNNVTVGTGQVDIAGIVREANRTGRVHWHFLEDESPRVLEQLPSSLHYLKKLGR